MPNSHCLSAPQNALQISFIEVPFSTEKAALPFNEPGLLHIKFILPLYGIFDLLVLFKSIKIIEGSLSWCLNQFLKLYNGNVVFFFNFKLCQHRVKVYHIERGCPEANRACPDWKPFAQLFEIC